MTEYSEEACITAGELRELGVTIPFSIPDCGWVPRHSMRCDDFERVGNVINFKVTFTEKFQWVEVSGVVE